MCGAVRTCGQARAQRNERSTHVHPHACLCARHRPAHHAAAHLALVPSGARQQRREVVFDGGVGDDTPHLPTRVRAARVVVVVAVGGGVCVGGVSAEKRSAQRRTAALDTTQQGPRPHAAWATPAPPHASPPGRPPPPPPQAGAPTTSLSTHMGMLSVIKQSCVLQPCMAAERGGPGSAVCARQVPAWLQPAATNSNCNGIGHAHLLLLLLFLHHEHTAPTAAQLTE
jgi:hypothetical protein